MLSRVQEFISNQRHKRALRTWQRDADLAQTLDLTRLRALRGKARQIRHQTDKVIHIADGRLALPRIGNDAIRKPTQSDWAFRPQIWRGPIFPAGFAGPPSQTQIGDEAKIFHDCKHSAITMRQLRNTREGDLAPFGLRLDALHFDGSFLSLAIDLPADAVRGLRPIHILRLDAEAECESPLNIFVRLNIRRDPNDEQVVRELPVSDGMVEFDLAHTKLGDKGADHIWIDLIFNNPAMNQITLRDLTLCRRPRAEL